MGAVGIIIINCINSAAVATRSGRVKKCLIFKQKRRGRVVVVVVVVVFDEFS